MAWGWGKNEGEVEVEAPTDTDALSDMANVSLKIQAVLNSAKEKFEGKYDDVKLSVTVPALLQLVAQLKAEKSGDEVFQRDLMYRDAGEAPTAKDLEGLSQKLDFADWAYLSSTKELKENLTDCGYSLLKHETIVEAGSVGYYIAIDPKTKTALVGVKGTSSMTDMLTDCCAATVTHELERSFAAGDSELKEIRCHEGILISSKRLAKDLETFVKDLFIPLEYKLLLCGHSLGAGAASLTAVLLRSRYPDLIERDAVEVTAFASPPVLDHNSALASLSFITTIVNNSDIITRCSLANVEVLLKILSGIQEKLVEAGIDPVDYQSTKAFLYKLREGTGGDILMTTEEGFEALGKAQADVAVDDPGHLYVPGRVLLMYGKWQDKVKFEEEKKAKEEAEKEKGTEEEKEESPTPERPTFCALTNGLTASLRLIEIDMDLVGDHLIASYQKRVNGFLNAGSP